MKTLLILRHAKSSWDNPELRDFDRPLNLRGQKAARLMGNVIYKYGLQPDLFVSSPAKRAKQTVARVKETVQSNAKIKFDKRIYEASPATLRQVISELDNEIEKVLLVGHNPGLEGFIKFLTSETQVMPTAALAELNLNIEKWTDISAGCGSLKLLIRPKDEIKKLTAG